MVQKIPRLCCKPRIQTIEVKKYVELHLHISFFPFSNGIHICGNKGLDKMKSGVNIDCNYIIRVSKLMNDIELPRPTKKLFDIDGTELPVIMVETEV